MLDVLLHVIIVIFQLESYWWSWYGTLKHRTSKINDRFSRLHYVNLCKRLHWRMKCVTWLNSAITSKETQRRATIAREKKKTDKLQLKWHIGYKIYTHCIRSSPLPFDNSIAIINALFTVFFFQRSKWIVSFVDFTNYMTWLHTHPSRTYERFV